MIVTTRVDYVGRNNKKFRKIIEIETKFDLYLFFFI